MASFLSLHHPESWPFYNFGLNSLTAWKQTELRALNCPQQRSLPGDAEGDACGGPHRVEHTSAGLEALPACPLRWAGGALGVWTAHLRCVVSTHLYDFLQPHWDAPRLSQEASSPPGIWPAPHAMASSRLSPCRTLAHRTLVGTC